jgi:acyl-CoA thioester hydrolase
MGPVEAPADREFRCSVFYEPRDPRSRVIYDAHVEFTRSIGLGDDYVARTQCGKAVIESHMVYEREIALGDRIEVRSWLLAVDDKRLHFFHELFNATKGGRAATSEQIDIHIDLRARRRRRVPKTCARRCGSASGPTWPRSSPAAWAAGCDCP